MRDPVRVGVRYCPTVLVTGSSCAGNCWPRGGDVHGDAPVASRVALEPPGAASAQSAASAPSAVATAIAAPTPTPAAPTKEAPEQPQQAEPPNAAAKVSVSEWSKHEVKPPLSLHHTSWGENALPVLATFHLVRRCVPQNRSRSQARVRSATPCQPLSNIMSWPMPANISASDR